MRGGERERETRITSRSINKITEEKYERREISPGVIRRRLTGDSEGDSVFFFRLKE
jgi:hypothetical protein